MRHKLIIGRGPLAFAGTDEGFNPTVVVTPHRSRRPVVTMFTVCQPVAMQTNLAELTTGTAVETPPDAHRHAILQTYHGLANIVHLVGIAYFAILHHLLEEAGEVGKRASQLVGVAPVVVLLTGHVPVHSLVVVQGVASHHSDVGTARIILLEQLCHLILLGGRCTLFHRPVVALVER